jgi:predicted nucleic acid-binding protein
MTFISALKKTNLKIIELEENIIQKSLKITQMGHDKSGFPSFYDSVYHAIAIENNCDFITADKVHFDKVKQLGNIKFLGDEGM